MCKNNVITTRTRYTIIMRRKLAVQGENNSEKPPYNLIGSLEDV